MFLCNLLDHAFSGEILLLPAVSVDCTQGTGCPSMSQIDDTVSVTREFALQQSNPHRQKAKQMAVKAAFGHLSICLEILAVA